MGWGEREGADELQSLRRWKAEATEVIVAWEKVWEAMGRPGPLGSSKAAACLAVVSNDAGRLSAAEATVHDLSARLTLTELEAGPALAWVPAGGAVRRFAAALDELSTHDRDELRFLSAAIAQQLTQFDCDPHDGRTGAGALGVLLAAHDHTHLLADHGRLDPAIASGVARVLVTVAVALSGFAPEEVRNP